MRQFSFLGLIAGLAAVAFGDVPVVDYVWTGAADAYWTNAANWTVGGAAAARCPGVAWTNGMTTAALRTAAVAEYATARSCATFDATGAGRTAVDLDGLALACQVLVTGADAPTYTFGTDSNQVLRLACTKTSLAARGEFRIAADVANMPVVKARFGVYQADAISSWAGRRGNAIGYQIVNENERPFVIEAIGGFLSGDRTTIYYFIYLNGTGPVTLAGSPTDDPSVIHCAVGALQPMTLTIRGTVENLRAIDANPGQDQTFTLHLPEDASLRFASPAGDDNTGWTTYYCTFRITGTGHVTGVDTMVHQTYAHFYPRGQEDLPQTLTVGQYPTYVHLPAGEDLVIPTLLAPSTQLKTHVPITFYRDLGTKTIRVTSLAGADWPWWLRLDNAAGRILADGRLVAAAPATDTEVAAKGDTIPDDVTKIVGITSEGTGANTSLVASYTKTKALFHVATNDATVAIGANETLRAWSVVRADGAGAFTVGETPGAGSLVVWVLDNRDTTGTLTINPPCTGPSLTLTDTHHATLAGGVPTAIPLSIQHGRLELTGANPYAFTSAILGKAENVRPMSFYTTLDVRDTELVIGDGLEGFAVGRHPNVASKQSDCYTNSVAMTVRDATIRSTVPPGVHTNNETTAASTVGALSVGNTMHASLEILNGAVVSNRLIVGGVAGAASPADGITAYPCQRGIGGVYQRGGDVTLVGASAPDYADRYGSTIGTLAPNSIGYYELSGGTLRTTQVFSMMAGSGSLGVDGGLFAIRGGTFTTPSAAYLGVGNGVRAEIYQTGGRVTFGGALTMPRSWNGGSRAFLTLDGPLAECTVNGYVYLSPNMQANTPNHFASVNLNAGTLTSQGFGTGLKARADDAWLAVTFNGGTFRVGRADMDLFVNPWPAYYKPVDRVYVFAGGATVDTDGKDASSSVPFTGATGGGVTGVTGFVPYRDVAPSPVRIVGDGKGAQAVMLYDSATQTATGIKIVCPGIGYTQATAQYDNGALSTADNAHVTTLACTVAPNANTGSLTKTGDGALTLTGANTYGGKTVLREGTLVIAADGAFPAGSTVAPQGGTLEFADGVTLPATLTVDTSALVIGRSYSPIVFRGTPGAYPQIAFTGDNAGNWRARIDGGTVVLTARRSTCLFIGGPERGVKWRHIGAGMGGNSYWLTVDPNDDQTLFYAPDVGGIYRTKDGGRSWTHLGVDFSHERRIGTWQMIEIAPSDSKVIYASATQRFIDYRTDNPADAPYIAKHGLKESGLVRSTDGGDTWESLYRSPLRGGAIAIDPEDPNTLWVAGPGYQTTCLFGFGKTYDSHGEGWVAKSTDGGKTWNYVYAGCTDSADANARKVCYSSLLVDPASQRGNRTLYLSGNGGGVWKSTDGGDTWKAATNGLPTTCVGQLAMSFGSEGTLSLYAAGCFSPCPESSYPELQASNRPGIYRSDDGGANWYDVSGSLSRTIGRYRITVSPRDKNAMYTAQTRGTELGTEGMCVWKTTDGGTTWTKCMDCNNRDNLDAARWNNHYSYLASPDTFIQISPRHPEKLWFADAGCMMWESHDAGGHWSIITSDNLGDNRFRTRGMDNSFILSLSVSPKNRKFLTMCCHDFDFLSSVDCGKTFFSGGQTGGIEASGSKDGTFGFMSVCHDPTDPLRAYAGSKGWSAYYSEGGVFLTTTDGGYTWHAPETNPAGMKFGSVADIFSDAAMSNIVDRGKYGIYRNGSLIYHNWAIRHLTIDPTTGRIFATKRTGVYYSDDRGGTWTRATFDGIGKDCDWSPNYVQVDPTTGRVYALAAYMPLSSSGLYNTLHPSTGTSLFTASNDPQNGLYVSDDGGATFRRFGTRANRMHCPVHFAVAPGGRTIYVGTHGCTIPVSSFSYVIEAALFRSDDAGETWKLVLDGRSRRSEASVQGIAIRPDRPEVVYVAMSDPEVSPARGAILRTTDAGATWEDISGDASHYSYSWLSLSPADPADILVGTAGGGAYIGHDYDIDND